MKRPPQKRHFFFLRRLRFIQRTYPQGGQIGIVEIIKKKKEAKKKNKKEGDPLSSKSAQGSPQ